MAKLRVYGGLIMGRGKHQVRTIVSAPSKKAAAEIFGMTVSNFASIFTETGNGLELRIATGDPYSVFQSSGTMESDFVKVDPKTRKPAL